MYFIFITFNFNRLRTNCYNEMANVLRKRYTTSDVSYLVFKTQNRVHALYGRLYCVELFKSHSIVQFT